MADTSNLEEKISSMIQSNNENVQKIIELRNNPNGKILMIIIMK